MAEDQAPEAQQEQQKPPWGDDTNFDPQKAWDRIQKQSRDIDTLRQQLKETPAMSAEDKAKLAEFDKMKAASQTDLERAQTEATRWQTEAETWRKASVSSTVKALAAAEFEYPDDAVNALRDNNYLDAGGQIDERAIKGDLEKLLNQRPNWRRANGEGQGARPPRPNAAQGTGGANSTDPGQQFAAVLNQAMSR